MFIFILLIFQCIFSINAMDFDRRLISPRSLALGGAMTARISLNESLNYNPASSAHSKLYSIEASYGFRHKETINNRVDTYNISVIDTKNKTVGAGLSYSRRRSSKTFTEWDINGILNKTFFKNKAAFGLGIDYTSYNVDSNFNLDFGGIVLLGESTIFGFTAYNLLDDDTSDINTRSIALGIRQKIGYFFAFSLDFEHKIKKKTNIIGAIEFLYKNGIMFAASFKRKEETNTNYWGAGIGYVGPKFSTIYGTMNSFNAPKDFIHSFMLRVYF
jgi:hypothetical protein